MWSESTYRIALFGHRDFSEHRMLDVKLDLLLTELIDTKPCLELYIGRNGEFDVYAASVIKRFQKRVGKASCALILVLPYPQRDMEYYEAYYDSVMIPERTEKTHPKGAITKRNRLMVEQADLVISCVQRKKGGAYAALQYAKKLNKTTVNLAEL